MRSTFIALLGLALLIFAPPVKASASRYRLGRGGNVSTLHFTDAVLRDRDLSGIRAVRTLFVNADLAGTDLRGADLRRARFNGADLRGADLRTTRRNLRRARFTGARFDEFTQLPEHWGAGHADRIEFAIRLGMRFTPTIESLHESLRLLDSPANPCDPSRNAAAPRWTRGTRAPEAAPLSSAAPPSPWAGGWRGELGGREVPLTIRKIEGSRYLGEFTDALTGTIYTLTIWAESGNRAFVEWKSSFGDEGRGWMLISDDLDALTGTLGYDLKLFGVDVTFFRECTRRGEVCPR